MVEVRTDLNLLSFETLTGSLLQNQSPAAIEVTGSRASLAILIAAIRGVH